MRFIQQLDQLYRLVNDKYDTTSPTTAAARRQLSSDENKAFHEIYCLKKHIIFTLFTQSFSAVGLKTASVSNPGSKEHHSCKW